MIRVEIHETVHRPIGDVFDRLVDIEGYNRWMPRRGLYISGTKDAEGPVGVGTPYTDRTRAGPLHGEVVTFERPRSVVFHYTMRLFGLTLMEGWPGYTLEAMGDHATRVHHHAHARLYGPTKLFGPILQWVAGGERRRTVRALKASLESPAEPPPAARGGYRR